MKMKHVLVTGGAGFIGSNLVKTLVDRGIEVDIVDNMSNGHKAFVPAGCNLFIADFASEDILLKIKAKTYDVVFHLAAIPRVSYSVEHPVETHETNVSATLKLIDTCRNNIKRFCYILNFESIKNNICFCTKSSNCDSICICTIINKWFYNT